MSARERMLGDIRRALAAGQGHAAASDPLPIEHGTVESARLVEQFAQRVAEYKAWVGVCRPAELAAQVASRLALRGERFVAAHDFPAAIVGEQWLVRDAGLTYAEIAAADGVVSLAAVGIAQTGTIILDAGVGQGRRVITLLPDFHLCIVQASQIVVDVPTAMRAVAPAVHERRAPLTLISGPSATSDIELNRVEGVHGPRQLEVLIVE